jgi:lipoprotein-anchoring transpeptidase ErfK/SrfK
VRRRIVTLLPPAPDHQGWGGGDRIAIHGTTTSGSVGTPASHGCMRASESAMRRLMGVIPLGTTVRIHA